jgi:hypothetical protein
MLGTAMESISARRPLTKRPIAAALQIIVSTMLRARYPDKAVGQGATGDDLAVPELAS